MILIETRFFTSRVEELLDRETYRHLQNELLKNPVAGAVIPSCAGLRKIRAASSFRQKGRRGGCRIIYLHVPLVHRIYFIAIYGKNEQDNLTEQDVKNLRHVVDHIHKEADQLIERGITK